MFLALFPIHLHHALNHSHLFFSPVCRRNGEWMGSFLGRSNLFSHLLSFQSSWPIGTCSFTSTTITTNNNQQNVTSEKWASGCISNFKCAANGPECVIFGFSFAFTHTQRERPLVEFIHCSMPFAAAAQRKEMRVQIDFFCWFFFFFQLLRQ